MKYSLHWLKEFVDIPISPGELAEKLLMAGHEVESIASIGENLKQIFAGKIVSIKKHPNADRLSLVELWDGKTSHSIVTGATNIKEGDCVPLTVPGSVLADGTVLKPTVLRGIESKGMICSQKELGVSAEAQGIWILPSDTPVGSDLIEHAILKDTIFDIAILPNRGDCLSHLGLAREISAILNTPLRVSFGALKEEPRPVEFNVKVECSDVCPKYTARIVESVSPKPSPLWMQRRLQLLGIRPINLLVDVTNYVLLELGQPLHAFDKTAIRENQLIIRLAKTGETIVTLDEEKREIPPGTILVCDPDTILAVGGVMGASGSGIQDTTTTVVLESAYFDPKEVRRASAALTLRTESSIRFERGVDSEIVETASDRAATLLREWGGGKVLAPRRDCVESNHPVLKPKWISFSAEGVNDILGTRISEETQKHILSRLGFAFHGSSQVSVPSWRNYDCEDIPCLSEEIIRIIGYATINPTLPIYARILEKSSKKQQLSEKIEALLIAYGFTQINTFPMVAKEDFTRMKDGLETAFVLKNPLTPNESVMRKRLLPSFLKVLGFNARRQQETIKLFEIGKTFDSSMLEPKESVRLGAIMTGRIFEAYHAPFNQGVATDFSYLKGIVQSLIEIMGVKDVQFSYEPRSSFFHPKKSAYIVVNNQPIGEYGVLHPLVLKAYDIDRPCAYVEMELESAVELKQNEPAFTFFSKYPYIRRDIAFLIPKYMTFREIEEGVQSLKPETVTQFFLFDWFESDKLGEDRKSLAMAFIYQRPDRTLSDEEVNTLHAQFCEQLKVSLPITIR